MLTDVCIPTRMNHLDAMLDSNLDDFVTCQVCADWGILSSLSDNICFVGLCWRAKSAKRSIKQGITSKLLTLPVHAKSVLITRGRLVFAVPRSSLYHYLKTATVCNESSCAFRKSVKRFNACRKLDWAVGVTYCAENLNGGIGSVIFIARVPRIPQSWI